MVCCVHLPELRAVILDLDSVSGDAFRMAESLHSFDWNFSAVYVNSTQKQDLGALVEYLEIFYVLDAQGVHLRHICMLEYANCPAVLIDTGTGDGGATTGLFDLFSLKPYFLRGVIQPENKISNAPDAHGVYLLVFTRHSCHAAHRDPYGNPEHHAD